MKKIFSQIILAFVFVFYVVIFHTSEAVVTSDIRASSSSVDVGKTITISWSSTGADSCSNNFNSSTATSGEYQYTAGSTTGSKTFTVTCTHTTVDPNTYYKLCPVTSGAGTYYTASTTALNSGQKVTGAIWCDSFYEYIVCGSSSNPNTYSAYGQIGITPSVCAAHQ